MQQNKKKNNGSSSSGKQWLQAVYLIVFKDFVRTDKFLSSFIIRGSARIFFASHAK
jgi:hypothetical protein